YSRIRAVGRGDYERLQRQQAVIRGIMSKFDKRGSDLISIIIKDILPNIETNLDYSKLFQMGANIMKSKSPSFDHARFPLDNASKGVMIDKVWYLSTDLPSTTKSLHNFIYKNISPN